MSWSAPYTYTTGQVVTAANLNTYVSNNLSFIAGQAVAQTLTPSSTNNVAYSDLGAAGPAVTVTTGTQAEVTVYCQLYTSASTYYAYAGVAISGATSSSATDPFSLIYSSPAPSGGNTAFAGCVTSLMTGLTAGSNTFTMKYKCSNATGTATFLNRSISVQPVPS